MSVSNFFRSWWGTHRDEAPTEEEEESIPPTSERSEPSGGTELYDDMTLDEIVQKLKQDAQRPLDGSVTSSEMTKIVQKIEQNTDRITDEISQLLKIRNDLVTHITNSYGQVYLDQFKDVLDGKYHLSMDGGDDFSQELFYADGRWIYGSEKKGAGIVYSFLPSNGTVPFEILPPDGTVPFEDESEEFTNRLIMAMFLDPRTRVLPFDWQGLIDEWKVGKNLRYTVDDDIYCLEDTSVYVRYINSDQKFEITNNATRLGRFAFDRAVYPEYWSWVDKS